MLLLSLFKLVLFVIGLPSNYGLYSGIMGGFVYFILGSCKDLNVGPTAIMALMIQRHVTVLGPAAAVLAAFLSGSVIFLCGIFHLGKKLPKQNLYERTAKNRVSEVKFSLTRDSKIIQLNCVK